MLEFGNEHPMVFIIPCLLLGAVSLYSFVTAFAQWRKMQPVMAAFSCLAGIAYLWPISLTAKIAGFGPEVLRWYVADLGFVPMFGLIVARQAFSQKLFSRDEARSLYYARMIDRLAAAKRLMIVAFVGITAYEIFMGIVYATNPDIEVDGVGSTDPIDLALYIVGLSLGLYLVNVMKKPIMERLVVAQEAEAKERAEQAARVRAIKQAKRKQRTRRRR